VGRKGIPLSPVFTVFASDPSDQALVLFGSRARGSAREDSDLDLLVIEKQSELVAEQRRQCWWRHHQQLRDLPLPLALVVARHLIALRLNLSDAYLCEEWNGAPPPSRLWRHY